MTIKDVFDRLTDTQRRQLLYAHNHGLTQHVELDGRYIGVNTRYIKHLVPEQESGAWSIGSVKRGMEETCST